MKCPNCGKDVEDGNFCSACGHKLKTNKVLNFLKKIPLKNSLIILFSIILLIVIGFITLRFFHPFLNDSSIAIEIIEPEMMKNLSVYDAIEELSNQDKKILEFASKQKQDIDKPFEIFYKNLLTFTGKDTEFESKLYYGLSDADKEYYAKQNFGIEFKEVKTQYKDYDRITVVLEEPKTELFVMLDDGEGGYKGSINYNYLVNTYSKYLSKSWQDYLKLKQKELNDRDFTTYYVDGYPHSQDYAADWYIANEKFREKYPDFIMNDVLKDEFKSHGNSILSRGFLAFEGQNNGEAILFPHARKAYEKVLAQGNNETDEYKNIQKWYTALKKNNFKDNSDLYNYLYELTGDECDKREYEFKKELEEKANQEKIIQQLEKNETREKIAEHIYFDRTSLETSETTKEGLFKIYKGADCDILEFDLEHTKNAIYAIYRINISTDGDIKFIEWEYFDKDNNTVSYFHPRGFSQEHYSQYKNGKIYHDVLFN